MSLKRLEIEYNNHFIEKQSSTCVVYVTLIRVASSEFQTDTLPLESPLIIWKSAVIARHQTRVSLFLSTLPSEIRCRTVPEVAFHTRMLSMPPVTRISSSRCHAIDKILALLKKICEIKFPKIYQKCDKLLSCLLKDFSNMTPSIWIS